MNNIRIIPRLDIKGPNLVKGIHLEGLRVLGKPENFARYYYENNADELLYIDAVASLYGRNNLLDIVTRTAEQVFIPLTVGGGIRTVKDIKELLRAGADKVAINTAAIINPALIKEAAAIFGSQCIVLSIQAKHINNRFEAFTDNGREATGREVIGWAQEAVALGAGEILLTSLDREGTGRGFETELVRNMSNLLPVPVIACGGAGKPEDFLQVVADGNADAVCAASIFHYAALKQSVDVSEYSQEGNIEFLKRTRGDLTFMPGKIFPTGIPEVKKILASRGIACRIDN